MRRLVPAVLGLVLSAGFIGLVLVEVDPRAALATLSHTNLLLLPLAFVPLVIDMTARTVRWHVLLAREPRPGYPDTFRYLAIGYLVNIILPGRLGEFVRAHLVGTSAHVGRLRALGSIALERGLDLVVAATLGAIAAYGMALHGGVLGGFALLAALGWIVLTLITLVPHALVRRLIDGVVRRFEHAPLGGVLPHLGTFGHALVDAAAPRLVLIALALSVVSWLSAAAVFAIAASALGLNIPPLVLLAIVTAANLGTALPSAPAGVGPFEFAVVFVAGVAGVDASAALALGILSHLLTTVPVAAAGAVCLPAVHWDLGSLRASAQTIKAQRSA